ncbi:uncharacterized protein LOC108679606 [Hyalella azteca]|uniref:Uncharacterized protein LOC108679606 n=1 Tax=Hyalella azteca TaxID=294128 RepID=A0A8B7PCK4_HYAAZ|nr:uncharacterized protein LOC108679606 [Hyalella azteca]
MDALHHFSATTSKKLCSSLLNLHKCAGSCHCHVLCHAVNTFLRSTPRVCSVMDQRQEIRIRGDLGIFSNANRIKTMCYHRSTNVVFRKFSRKHECKVVNDNLKSERAAVNCDNTFLVKRECKDAADLLYMQRSEETDYSLLSSAHKSNPVKRPLHWTRLFPTASSLRVYLIILLFLAQCSAKLVAGFSSQLILREKVKNHPPHQAIYPMFSSASVSRSIRSSDNSAEADFSYPLNSTLAFARFSDANSTSPKVPDSCEVSNIKCALRSGCGMALQKYMLDCADLISGRTERCDDHCKDSLLILTSTQEGRALMECACSDQFCEDTKARLEVCREEVLRLQAHYGEYSCRLAHLLCTADTRCATAIAYYDKFCRRMFSGRSCSARCNNSISILQRQEKAARLEACECDGSEPFDCHNIKKNMARLCFHKLSEEEKQQEEEETNEIDTSRLGDKSRAATACLSLLLFAAVGVASMAQATSWRVYTRNGLY